MISGYYLEDADELVSFPLACRLDSNFDEREGIDIALEAERGRMFVYKQGERGKYTLNFRVSDTNLAQFRALHDLVGGRETPFYFVPDVDASPMDAVYVRKERDFRKRFVVARIENGSLVRYWDYTLELTEEIDTEFEIDA